MSDCLNTTNMSAKWGGAQPAMHSTTIHEAGPFNPTLSVNDTQQMVFKHSDKGPFYLKHPKETKTTKFTGKRVKRKKKKLELLDELRQKKGFVATKWLSMTDVEKICERKGILTEVSEKEMIQGWVGQPKGLLQVLWERGFINPECISLYSLKGKPTNWTQMVRYYRNTNNSPSST